MNLYLQHSFSMSGKVLSRDAPIAIFLADSDILFLSKSDLPIPIFFLRNIIDSILNNKYILMQIIICIVK